MSISYPLSIPSSPGFVELVFEQVNLAGLTRSEFTGQQQVTQWNGEWWELTATVAPIKSRAIAEPWEVFLTFCRGMVGTFLIGPETAARTALGTPSAVTVSGASQTGTTITLAGSGSFAAGDYIQLGSGATARLHKIYAAGSVAGTHDIFPRLRESPTNGSAVVVASPKGVFRLAENRRGWTVDRTKFYEGFQFKAIEAI